MFWMHAIIAEFKIYCRIGNIFLTMVQTILSFWDYFKLTDILVSSDIESDSMNTIVF